MGKEDVIVTEAMVTCTGCADGCHFNLEQPWKSTTVVNCAHPELQSDFESEVQTAKARIQETQDAAEAAAESDGAAELDYGLRAFGGVESARHRLRSIRH